MRHREVDAVVVGGGWATPPELVEEDAVRLVGERGDLRGLELASGRVPPTSRLLLRAHEPATTPATALGGELDAAGAARTPPAPAQHSAPPSARRTGRRRVWED